MSDRQKVIIALIKESDTITISQMIPVLKVSQITIKRDLGYLQEAGIITRIGNKVSGHWEVIATK
ncbi:MAG: DeoR family transcriptional regulator [Paludibacteraceae bacterium]|nr:DeoR family transcriptional regulator [Paludibacteraceae bacterium]